MLLRCDICEQSIDTDAVYLDAGWRKLWIDIFDQLFVSTDLRRGVNGYTGMIAVSEATACGQMHALVLTERYLERGTFEPADFHTNPAPDADLQPHL